jgi:hypothetical protein
MRGVHTTSRLTSTCCTRSTLATTTCLRFTPRAASLFFVQSLVGIQSKSITWGFCLSVALGRLRTSSRATRRQRFLSRLRDLKTAQLLIILFNTLYLPHAVEIRINRSGDLDIMPVVNQPQWPRPMASQPTNTCKRKDCNSPRWLISANRVSSWCYQRKVCGSMPNDNTLLI